MSLKYDFHVLNLQFYSDSVTTNSIDMLFTKSFRLKVLRTSQTLSWLTFHTNTVTFVSASSSVFCWKLTVSHDFTRDVLMSHTLSQDSHMRFTRDVKVFFPVCGWRTTSACDDKADVVTHDLLPDESFFKEVEDLTDGWVLSPTQNV